MITVISMTQYELRKKMVRQKHVHIQLKFKSKLDYTCKLDQALITCLTRLNRVEQFTNLNFKQRNLKKLSLRKNFIELQILNMATSVKFFSGM